MAVSLTRYVQKPLAAGDEWTRLSSLADELLRHLNTGEVLARIRPTE
jgi:hypothetical protein